MTESRYRAVKAYENTAWIHSRDARALRILSEYLEPASRFEELGVEDTIVVFGSARLLPKDVAEKLGVDLRAYHLILTESSAAHVFSFDQPDEHTGETLSLPQSAEATPSEQVEYQSFRAALAECIKHLPERESLVMSLYYDENLNLREIGEILGVSESRVCQIHGQAMTRLKGRLSDWTQR